MNSPIETKRLYITKFNENMAESVHKNSLDEDNRLFLPDEVFETLESAQEVIKTLVSFYEKQNVPLIYPIVLKNDEQIGHVQAIPIENGWEVGYHIGKQYAGNGYATEALCAFVPEIMKKLNIKEIFGICRLDNIASWKVLEKCGFKLEYEGVSLYHGKEHHIRRYKKELI